ncbi:lytic transglycosylase domain-containing protein [Streptomyces sp. NPDC058430]|uniref:lytic transglycosylase domain-containing protein n=1 Tax=Streptomyces sp. NPDC058430 TaxID=3346495 RepID=UPI003664D3B1
MSRPRDRATERPTDRRTGRRAGHDGRDTGRARGRGGKRRTLLWHQILSGAVAVAATGGMATVTLWQLADMSPVAAASPSAAPSQAGGGSPPLYPDAPALIPGTRPVPFKDKGKGEGGAAEALPVLPTAYGIPGRVLAAYRSAAKELASEAPRCGIEVPLLAAIGRVESGHARGGALDAQGRTRSPILGPRLDGSAGVAAIHDTDDGVWDGDRVWDRAVGPAQFIPSTWRRWGSDGNGDGVRDPHQIDDAWLAAGRYLCTAGGDLSQDAGIRKAVLAYNHSDSYLELVLSWMRVYAHQAVATAGHPGRSEPSHQPTKGSHDHDAQQPTTPPSGQSSPPGDDGKEGHESKPTLPGIPTGRPPSDDPKPTPLPSLRLPSPGYSPSPLFPSPKPS